MKSFIFALLMLPSLVFADTFIGLNNPSTKGRWVCAGETFSADGTTVSGICQITVPSSMRYAQPARYQYNATWITATGAVTLGDRVCYVPQHMGAGPQPGCPQMVSLLDTNEVVTLDGVPFWYVTTSVTGAMLLHIQNGSLVFLP